MFTRALIIATLVLIPQDVMAEAGHALSHDIERYEDQPVTASVNWVADWQFEGGSPCDMQLWTTRDERIKNTGSVSWQITNTFGGQPGITGNAAVLAESHPCWVYPDGYANDWYMAIRIPYSGVTTLTFDYVLDAETGCDRLIVETDPGCGSFSLVDYNLDPSAGAASFRTVEFVDTGSTNGNAVIPLTNHGAGTHCVTIAFRSDEVGSPADGRYNSVLGAALVIDNISLSGTTTYSENFTGGTLGGSATFVNLQDNQPFGNWGRLFSAVPDDDACTGNATCSWLLTDNTSPTLGAFPDLQFGPGAFVIRNWLDESLVSPWVSLAGTPDQRTWLEFDVFPGNNYEWSRLALNVAVRGRSAGCVSEWRGVDEWHTLGASSWLTRSRDLSCLTRNSDEDIQIRFRLADMQLADKIGAPPHVDRDAGPGPYLDSIRIGREMVSGPVLSMGIDSRSQAQDAFATQPLAHSGPPNQQSFQPHQGPDARFETAAFSAGADLGVNGTSPNVITADSITVCVRDVRNSGGITSVELYASIVAGPHAGKAPPPYSVGPNGFFAITADNVRNPAGQIIADEYFVDMDDEYFRGGDVLVYFWLAEDAGGMMTSHPEGVTNPAGITPVAAEVATGGLHEVSFLPRIDWDPAYVARIAADPSGKLTPTATEIANSTQHNDILYVQKDESYRRSSLSGLNRTAFMATLDLLGYEYDVYDVQGFGNTNNDLGSRATLQQSTGYAFIAHDAGRRRSGAVPDGSDPDAEKIDQATWYSDYLSNGSSSEAGIATLLLMGENVAEELMAGGSTLLTMTGVALDNRQVPTTNTAAAGVNSFTFTTGNVGVYASTAIPLVLPCSSVLHADHDDLATTGSGTDTHQYGNPTPTGDIAVVMNKNVADNWNSILTTFTWADVVTHLKPASAASTPPVFPTPGTEFLGGLLEAVLPGPPPPVDPTGVSPPSAFRTTLRQNHPNPFNPSTRIGFQLQQASRVEITVFDVLGRRVRSLVRGVRAAGPHEVTWDGRDDSGASVASGVYLYRMATADFEATRRMLLLQ